MKKTSGFTLIELMIVLFIASVLLVGGIPALTDMVRNNRMLSAGNLLVTDLNVARSEAIKRNQNVVICSTTTPNAAAPACATAADWGSGWIVFVDSDSNGAFAGADILLRRGQAPGGNITMDGSAASVAYRRNGAITSAATVSVALCDQRTPAVNFGRRIDVSPLGRPQTFAASAATPLATCTP